MVLKMSGHLIKEALEWSVGAYPSEEGRFPSVSNMHFLFDPEKPAGQRVFTNEITTLTGGNFDLNR